MKTDLPPGRFEEHERCEMAEFLDSLEGKGGEGGEAMRRGVKSGLGKPTEPIHRNSWLLRSDLHRAASVRNAERLLAHNRALGEWPDKRSHRKCVSLEAKGAKR